jgi:hypothetical protein
MKRDVRPSTPADAPAIVDLFTQAGLQPNADPQALHWKYWQERPDWPWPRSYVLTTGPDLIAHGAFVPGRLAWGARRETTGHVIDWAARPGEFGAGTMIMKHIGQQVDSLLAIGGSADTLRILPHIGFRALGTVTGYVRPLFPVRSLHRTEKPSWKSLPRFIRNVAWKLAAPAPGSQGWQAKRILRAEDLDELASVLPVPTGATTLLRDVELFRYMLGCPIIPMQLFAVDNGGGLRGYFLLASAPGQVRIVDCWVASTRTADWSGMILCAVQEALKDSQAAEVVTWASDPLLGAALVVCGFHARDESQVQWRAAPGAALPPSPLRIQMLDNDAAYLSDDYPQFWA